MRLHIEHVTIYPYTRPVTFGRHRLVLRPREGHDLRVERMHWSSRRPHASSGSATSSATRSRWSTFSSPPTRCRSSTTSSGAAVAVPGRDLHEPWRVPFPPRTTRSRPRSPPSTRRPPISTTWRRCRRGCATRARRDRRCGRHDAGAVQARRSRCAISGDRRRACRRRRRRCARDRFVPRHGDADDGGGAGLGVAARFASGYLHGRASMADRRPRTPGPRSICRRSAGAASIRRSATHGGQPHRHRRQHPSARRDAGVRRLHRRARRLSGAKCDCQDHAAIAVDFSRFSCHRQRCDSKAGSWARCSRWR